MTQSLEDIRYLSDSEYRIAAPDGCWRDRRHKESFETYREGATETTRDAFTELRASTA
jgi:hypothetical protein